MRPEEELVADMLDAIRTLNIDKAWAAIDAGVDVKAVDAQNPLAWKLIRKDLLGSSLLHEAVTYSSRYSEYQGRSEDRIEIVEMLLGRGAEVNCANWEGFTPLHNAAIVNHAAACHLLIGAGAQVDRQSVTGHTAIAVTSKYDSKEACAVLLLHGEARIDLVNRHGETALDYSQRKDSVQIQGLLRRAALRSVANLSLAEIDASQKGIDEGGEDPYNRPSSFLAPARPMSLRIEPLAKTPRPTPGDAASHPRR